VEDRFSRYAISAKSACMGSGRIVAGSRRTPGRAVFSIESIDLFPGEV